MKNQWEYRKLMTYERSGKWAIATLLHDGTAATIAQNGSIELFDTKPKAEERIAELMGEKTTKELIQELAGLCFDNGVGFSYCLDSEAIRINVGFTYIVRLFGPNTVANLKDAIEKRGES